MDKRRHSHNLAQLATFACSSLSLSSLQERSPLSQGEPLLLGGVVQKRSNPVPVNFRQPKPILISLTFAAECAGQVRKPFLMQDSGKRARRDGASSISFASLAVSQSWGGSKGVAVSAFLLRYLRRALLGQPGKTGL